MIPECERRYLRDLAKRQKELANKPVMKERERLWYLHNSLAGERPMVVMEEETFLQDILPVFTCQSVDGQWIEKKLLQTILPEQIFQDDKVVTEDFKVNVQIKYNLFGVPVNKVYASDGIAYHIKPALQSLEDDMQILKDTTFEYNKNETMRRLEVARNVLGDILHVRLNNAENYWAFSLTQRIIELMGMENMFCAMKTEPDEYHELMSRLVKDMVCFLRWQEKEKVLFINNKDDYMGSGSLCFTKELPDADFDGNVLSKHLWGHLNSQESVGLSPEMYHEFIAPYFSEMANEFGLVYYGCCEPVELYWERDISKYSNLRKVSISPWCDEKFMSERLEGGDVIYSRKPSPNFLGIQKAFDEDAFRKYIRTTVELTKKCKIEYIFRDIYQLHGNLDKVARAVQIVREEVSG